MSKLFDEIKKHEFRVSERIEKSEYIRAKKELTEEEFNKQFFVEEQSYFFKWVDKSVNENEVDTFLLYESLKEQRKMKKSISLIAGILTTYAIITVLGAIIIYVQFFR